MATNFAADTLKFVISKAATALTSDVAASDSAVAEFRPHPFPSTDARESADGAAHTAPGLPTLSDSAVAELKAAYLAVEQAIGDAREGAATDSASTGTTTTSSTTSSTETAEADQPADASAPGGAHQPPAGPLATILAAATGETIATVQAVLQQVHAVLRQEHATDAPAQEAGASATAGTSTDMTAPLWHDRPPASSGSTGTADAGDGASDEATGTSTATTDADAGGKAFLWHDHVAAWLGGTAGQDGAADGRDGLARPDSSSALDTGDAVWQHHVMQHAAVDTAVTTDAAVVSAVDDFAALLQSLQLDPLHGHVADPSQLDAAA